jgi:hypothetical protein
VKKGDNEVAGLTDVDRPRRLGPKRANKIRKLHNLSKEDDVRKFVIAREYTNKKGKNIVKKPKIQRLITPQRLQRKRAAFSAKRAAYTKSKEDRAEYERLKLQRGKERRQSELASKLRRSSRKSSKKEATA